jgi:hypothetical protein
MRYTDTSRGTRNEPRGPANKDANVHVIEGLYYYCNYDTLLEVKEREESNGEPMLLEL